MSDSILVTGDTGFIGRHLVRALRAEGHAVFGHSRQDGDIARCSLSYSNVRHVYHLAGKTFVPESWQSPLTFYEVNVLGAVNVLEFCRRQDASLILLSSYVYGRPERLPIAEDHPLKAVNPYSHTKILAEGISEYYREQYGVRVTIVRPFNVYGPGQDERFLVPTLLRQAMSADRATIEVADVRPRRDFLFIADLVELLVLLARHNGSGIYNAGSGESVSIQELVDVINSLVPLKKQITCREAPRPEEILDVRADVQKAWRELTWKPRTSLACGLRHTLTAMCLQ